VTETAITPRAYSVAFFRVDVMSTRLGAFASVRGLEAQIDYLEYREGGLNSVVHRLPGSIRYPNLVFSQGLTTQGALEQWLSSSGIQPKSSTVVVTLCEPTGTRVRSWSFANAYPVRWTGPVLEAGGAIIAGEELEIAHGGFLS
jgi:phage tail-like protein